MRNPKAEIRRPKEIQNPKIGREFRFGFRPSDFFRISAFGFWISTVFLAPAVFAQKPIDRPKPLDPVEGERQAKQLIAEMLTQRPAENSTNTGQLKIRDANGDEREVGVRFEIVTTPTNWLSTYQVISGNSAGARLSVVHAGANPKQYQFTEGGGNGSAASEAKTLTTKQANIPFAGSDFWLSDLGLEFLHWPQQRLLRKEPRHSQSCGVLESINPEPGPGGYVRVVSWVDLDPPHGIVHADAYDANRKRIKQFDPKSVKKVQGQYELESMEMVDERTGSRTVIKFDL